MPATARRSLTSSCLGRLGRQLGALALAAVTSLTASAAPLQLQLLDQQFGLYSFSRLGDPRLPLDPTAPSPTVVSNVQISAFPLAHSVWSSTWSELDGAYTGPASMETQAAADFTQVHSWARSAAPVRDGQIGFAAAAALSQITFKSQSTGLGTFEFALTGQSQFYWGQQWICLKDLTLGVELWSRGYAGLGGGSMITAGAPLLTGSPGFEAEIPWGFNGTGYAAHLLLETPLNTTSIYELTWFTANNSLAPDTSGGVIDWITPNSIPEPSLFALTGLGGLAVAGMRMRRR